MSIKPAIVAVGYNRPDSMRRLLQSIVNAHYPFDGIDLIISIDESNRSDDVQKVADEFQWNYGNKIIKRYPERQGLRKHIIQCGDLSNQYGAVIILEDDLMVSPSFYNYTYAAINYYKDNPKIVGASLYSHCWNGYAGLQFIPEKNEYDAYLGQYSISWGQCWAKEQWNLFKEWYLLHEDKLPAENKAMPSTILRWSQQSWGKYFISYMVEKNLYYAVPYAGMTTNFSEMGTHNSSSSATFQVPLQQGNKVEYKLPDFEQAVKYDLFFERIFDKIDDIDGKDICVNLNGMKLWNFDKKYLLTDKKIPELCPVASYGMVMRPVDANITNQISGEDIFLYNIDGRDIPMAEFDCSYKRVEYETYGLFWKRLFKVGKNKLIYSIKSKLKK